MLGGAGLKIMSSLSHVSLTFSLFFFFFLFKYSVFRQNAELAKLRQECAKLTKELGEKNESVIAEEHIRKGLEAKVSATEKQLTLLQVSLAYGNTHSCVLLLFFFKFCFDIK